MTTSSIHYKKDLSLGIFCLCNIKIQIRSLPNVSPVAIVVAVPALRMRTNKQGKNSNRRPQRNVTVKNTKQNPEIMQHYETTIIQGFFTVVQ